MDSTKVIVVGGINSTTPITGVYNCSDEAGDSRGCVRILAVAGRYDGHFRLGPTIVAAA